MNDKMIDGHILHIVQNQEIAEQQQLIDQLQQRGFEVPQATLSRHLKKLGIKKKQGLYTVTGLQTPQLPVVLNLKINDTGLIVLHTHPGCANMLAYYIDEQYVGLHPGSNQKSAIIGTIAGDDTILIISQGPDHIEEVLIILKKDFPYLTVS